MSALPGVQKVGLVNCPPFGCHQGSFFVAEGAATRGATDITGRLADLLSLEGRLDAPEDFYWRKGRATCRRCELARGAESKRRARARVRAENPPKPRVRKPKVRTKRTPKKRVELTIKQVLEIRADYENNGRTYGWATATAKKYDMSVEAIRAIAKRRTWKDV